VADGPSPSKKMKLSKEDAEMKEQNKKMYKLRDQLKKELKKKDLQYLLEHNDQDVPVGEEKVCIPLNYYDFVNKHVCTRLYVCTLLATKVKHLKFSKTKTASDVSILLES
jgi:hypothetical protein